MNYLIRITKKDGEKLTLGGNVLSNIRRSQSFGATGYPIGKVAVGQLSFSCPKIEEEIADRALVELQASNFRDDGESDSVWMFFYLDKVKKNNSQFSVDRMTVSCYDRLAFANQPFDYEWAEGVDEKKNFVNFRLAVRYIVDRLGCEVRWLNCPVKNAHLSLGRDYTIREVLGHIAAANGGNCYYDYTADCIIIAGRGAEGKTIEISASQHTRVQTGKEWRAEGVVLSNGKSEVSVGELTEPTRVVRCEIPIATDELTEVAETLYDALRYTEYLPFSVDKMIAPLGIALTDAVTLGVETPLIYSLTADYSGAGCFATVSATDVNDTRSAFSFEKIELKKNQKVGTVEYGNKYGIKSTGKKKEHAVGADSTAQLQQMRMYNGEIIAEDITDEENTVEGGKLFLDNFEATVSGAVVNVPAMNLTIPAGVLGDEATDLIAELKKGGGGSDYPSWWIDLPPAPPGWIHLLVDDTISPMEFNSMCNDGDIFIDWGDGTTETLTKGTYEVSHIFAGGGTVVQDGTVQYIVRIQLGDSQLISGQIAVYGFNASAPVRRASFNAFSDYYAASMFSNCHTLWAVDFLASFAGGKVNTNIISYCYALKSVNVGPNTVLTENFCNCCHGLRKVISDNLIEQVDKGSFGSCHSLHEINLADGVTVDSSSSTFRYCYSLPENIKELVGGIE